MNYYIQGNKDKADQIKAAFEKKGIDVLDFGFADKTLVYCSIGHGCVQCLPYSINLMHILCTHPDYKELELPVEPKFKKGDWIACDADSFTLSIKSLKDGNYYFHQGASLPIKDIDEHYHLWTITDAKNGDVLVMDKTPINHESIFIFQKINEASVIHYCYYFNDNGEEVFGKRISNNIIGHTNQSFHPATREQRNLLFQKMKEAWYQWDADKKELRNIINPKFKVGDVVKTGNTIDTIAEVDYATRSYCFKSGRTIWFKNQDLWHLAPKPHYDIKNFKPFQKVLVRDRNNNKWQCAWFSNYDKTLPYPFITTGSDFKQCIPFNDDTKHLLGTTDPCDEQYINW